MKINKMHEAVLAIGAGLLASAVHAASPLPLQGRDINGAPVAADAPNAVFEYDPNLDITWLRNWNYAAGTSTAMDAGMMTWAEAKTWAATLTVGNFSGWSLPTTQVPDATCTQNSYNPGVGYGCRGSQMGYLWYTEFGNNYNPPVPPDYMPAFGPFQNVKNTDWYWSATEYRNLGEGMGFQVYFGFQNLAPSYQVGEAARQFAVAVRAGDVLTPVPEPMTWAVMVMGLGVLALGRSRRRG